MFGEDWKPVVGYEGRYEVSSMGRVRSLRSGIVMRQQTEAKGHRSLFIGQTGKDRKHVFTHILVAAAFIGARPEGHVINHRNGCPSDNRPSNLEYCTQQQNAKHAHRIGLQSNKGMKHSQARLTDTNIECIRLWAEDGYTLSSISKVYSLPSGYASRIVQRKAWSHVA